jgi:predicted transposase/invertase (TIGR01784 family)
MGKRLLLRCNGQSKNTLQTGLFFTLPENCMNRDQKGEKDWDYKLQEVYFIGLMDFNFDHTPSDKYLHRVRLAEEETGEIFYNKLGFIFIEPPNFNLTEKGIKTDLEGWLFVLRNMWKLKKIPVILHRKIFKKLFQISEIANLKKEDYMLYEKNLLDKWDAYSVLKTAKDKGIEEGKAEGKAEVVRNLINKFGFNDEQAASAAEVPVGYVKEIRASLKKKK